METAPLTLKQLNAWALEQIKGFVPTEIEAENRVLVTHSANAFMNGWKTLAKKYLEGSELSNQAIIYFAIRVFWGDGQKEHSGLAFIKEFVESRNE